LLGKLRDHAIVLQEALAFAGAFCLVRDVGFCMY
jgi:hypothetical protein